MLGPRMFGAYSLRAFHSHARLGALILTALLCWPALAEAKEPEERLGLDPILHGIWKVHATSENKGKTIKPIDPPGQLCRAYATKVKLANGTTLNVDKVMIMEDDDGDPMNVVRFDTGVIWAISKKVGNPYFLVQVFEGTSAKEKMRVLISVSD